MVRKVEKNAILQMDELLRRRKEDLLAELSLEELEGKKKEFFKDVEDLGVTMEEVYYLKNIDKAIAYIDEKSEKSYLLKNGEYLLLEMNSMHKVVRSKIEQEANQFSFQWNSAELETLLSSTFCTLKPSDQELYSRITEAKMAVASVALKPVRGSGVSSALNSKCVTPTVVKAVISAGGYEEEVLLLNTDSKSNSKRSKSSKDPSPIHPARELIEMKDAKLIQSYLCEK